MTLRELEKQLARLSYEDVSSQLATMDDTALIELLDSKSTKVGDTAASLLNRRENTDAVVDAILDRTLSTKTGKIRALYILSLAGSKCPRATEAYLTMIHDKNQDVVDSALFGLVFLQDKRNIVAIREAISSRPKGTDIHNRFSLALEALEQLNPFIFSPHYHDTGNVWGLNKERFFDRIG